MSNKTKAENSTTTTTTGTGTSTTASQWQTYNHYKAEQGWECPRCGRINAPWVRQCDCTRGTYDYDKWTITPTLTDSEWWKTYVTSSQADANMYTTYANHTVGGSDYWDSSSHSYVNTPPCATNTVRDEKLKYKEK